MKTFKSKNHHQPKAVAVTTRTALWFIQITSGTCLPRCTLDISQCSLAPLQTHSPLLGLQAAGHILEQKEWMKTSLLWKQIMQIVKLAGTRINELGTGHRTEEFNASIPGQILRTQTNSEWGTLRKNSSNELLFFLWNSLSRRKIQWLGCCLTLDKLKKTLLKCSKRLWNKSRKY